jgi:predicted metal-dependent hydrolase
MNTESVWNDSRELKGAVWQWADRIGVSVREVHLRDMRRKWASISTNGRLTLNTDLLDLPEALGEFVIVHELVHLLAPNHGRVFKSFMSAYLPDWEERQHCLESHCQTP